MTATVTASLTPYESEQLVRLFWQCGRAETVSGTARSGSSTPEVRPELQQIAGASIHDLSAVRQQLISLRKTGAEDHRGLIRPSDDVFELGMQLLFDAFLVLRQDSSRRVPQGCVSPDFEGGIRIEWVRPSASVHRVIGPGEASPRYMDHKCGADYGVDNRVSAERLAFWIPE